MRIAKTLEDLPVGTPIQIEGHSRTHKGLVIGAGVSTNYRQKYIKVLYSCGQQVWYYEDDLADEAIMIVETKKESVKDLHCSLEEEWKMWGDQ